MKKERKRSDTNRPLLQKNRQNRRERENERETWIEREREQRKRERERCDRKRPVQNERGRPNVATLQ